MISINIDTINIKLIINVMSVISIHISMNLIVRACYTVITLVQQYTVTTTRQKVTRCIVTLLGKVPRLTGTPVQHDFWAGAIYMLSTVMLSAESDLSESAVTFHTADRSPISIFHYLRFRADVFLICMMQRCSLSCPVGAS